MLRCKPFRTLLPLALLLFSGASFAVDPNGVWYGPSATRIRVVAAQDQVFVTINNAQGQIGPLTGKWNTEGERFSFRHNDWTYAAAIRNERQIDVTNPNGSTSVWQRGRMPALDAGMKAAPQGVDIAGLWRSTSGSSVQISAQGQQVFVTLINAAGKRFQGSGRWLQAGQTFDYSLPGYPGVATGTVHSAKRITVAYGATPSTWTRQLSAAPGRSHAPAQPALRKASVPPLSRPRYFLSPASSSMLSPRTRPFRSSVAPALLSVPLSI